MVAVSLPREVRDFARRGPEWAAYVDRLPRLVRELTEEWSLAVDGSPLHGFGSLVVPVLATERNDEPAMLKLAFPDEEGEHEALGLQRWAGRGAVRLLAADPHRRALLLERVHSRDLTSIPVTEACEVVAGLYAALHVPAPPQLRLLTDYLRRWAGDLEALPRDAPVPHRLAQQAGSLLTSFLEDEASTGVIVHGDLHYENVLAADRAPWLVIDPKPMGGDRHFEVAPMLWNRWEEAVATHDLRGEIRRRFHTLVDVAGLDEERARDWVVVRMMLNALWELQERSDDLDHEWLTISVTIAKAVQD